MNTAVLSLKTTLRHNLSRWQTIAGLDFHVFVTLLFRGWAVLAGGATVFLLPLLLSPTEQGYYFTFSSVLALQIFFELGLNQIIMQLVSHEVANLTETADGRLSGKDSHLGRLSSLARFLSRWYGVAAILFALIGGILGAFFFTLKGEEPKSVWLGVWGILVCSTAVNLWLSPGLAVMEGCGKVGQVARLRLIQSLLGYACLWSLLLSGAGLWAAIALPVISALCTGYWLRSHGDILRWLSRRATDAKNKINWRTDVLPLQWRIALSWVSGYLIFNLFTPMVFSNQGAVEAGRLGIALSLFSALLTIGMSWVNAKAPNFTMHIARGERHELNTLFKAVFLRSTSVVALTSVGVVIGIWYANQIGMPLITRIAPPGVLSILAVTTVGNSMIFGMALYMRAHREEPMLIPSIVHGLLMVCVVYYFSKIGVFLMMFWYMMTVLFISLPWAYILFIKYFRRTK